MLNPISIMADRLGDYLSELYLQYFAHRRPEYAAYMGGAARLVLERIGNSNALYHNVEHTIMVTLCGQQIIRGRLLSESLTPDDWLHYTCALLVHDIGMVRGVCAGDTDSTMVIDESGRNFTPARGASDAILAPYHVDRGKIYARQRFTSSQFVDQERIAAAIEMTRFPVPSDPEYRRTDTEGALVRAADLIGQLADPYYHRKLNALFAEMAETGMTEKLGCKTPADLASMYTRFFKEQVEPYIQEAIRYLELTTEGKQWIANLDSNLFQTEHRPCRIGPFPGPA
ncbi:metal-dependent phosphohydrolase [Mesorhizobium sp. ZMM04-5]|uniref:Metal-dependent phosphohydrolase n=2 Tax=Mesorhizobium marinum TaxID=3228790 RepID=A0ABV3R4S5_9HYPH